MSQEWDWQTLLADALYLGVGVAEFWDMTPRELTQLAKARKWQREQEMQRLAWLAWSVAALMRTKQLPSLRKWLGQDKGRPLTEAERAVRAAEHAELAEQVMRIRGQ